MSTHNLEKSPPLPLIRFGAALVALFVALYALYACAAELRIVHHDFSFGDINGRENQDIKILNYRYGDDKTAPTRPSEDQLTTGHIPQRMSMGTFAPPADSLYVKWRVQSTGKIYQDTVKLKKLLPSDMNNKEIHFTIQGPQLSVYVIDTEKGHLPGKDCPVILYKDCKCSRIYPDHWTNF